MNKNKLSNLHLQNLITALTLQQLQQDQILKDDWYYSTVVPNPWNRSWPNGVISDDNEMVPLKYHFVEIGKSITEKEILNLIQTGGYYADLIQIGCAEYSTYNLTKGYSDIYPKIWVVNFDWIHTKVGNRFQVLVDNLIASRANVKNLDFTTKFNDRLNANPHEFKNPPTWAKKHLIRQLKSAELKLY